MKISRKNQFRLVFLALVIMAGSVVVYANISLQVSSPVNVKGPTSATLNSAVISYPNQTATTPCNAPTGNTVTCPQVQLTLGGSATEAGNYTITVNFTATPIGSTININCTPTGPITCTATPATVFATGAAQVSSVFVKPGGTGSGTASVSVSG